jgi:hypothetical protein
MLELFLNPITMAVGGLLVLSPIIIHLINRMRFKKIRWAAIEFLLKAQKKKQRQILLEQLILLLLRILLVLLFALLLARFVGCNNLSGDESAQTLHVFLLDDTVSMGDGWREEGEAKNTFDVAKDIISEKIARFASDAPSPQLATILRLSDLENPRNFERLNEVTLSEMRSWLSPLKPSFLRVDLISGLKKVQEQREAIKAGTEVVLHIISDFRTVDWSKATESQLSEMFNQLRSAGVKIVLADVAHPDQGDQKNPLYHDNLAIVDLRPETRVAAQQQQVEFTVEVANYSNAERKNVRVAVKLNGRERAEGSVNIPTLPAKEITKARFQLAPDRVGSDENPLDRFNLVSAQIEAEAVGLNVDNIRYTVIEVRKQVPILLIEGKPGEIRVEGRKSMPKSKDAETFFLYRLFTDTVKGYDVEVRAANELDKLNLQQYLSVWICDVNRLSEAAVKNLEDYIRTGGGVAIFLGPDIKTPDATFYNEKLYRKGAGFYPAPLELKAFNDGIEDDKVVPSKWIRRLSGEPQVFPRNRQHLALEAIYGEGSGPRTDGGGYDRILQFVVIDRYFPINRLAWKEDPTLGTTTFEIMTLPNLKPMNFYEKRVRELMDQVVVLAEKFPEYEPALKTYAASVKSIAASNDPLFMLSKRVEEFLTDPGDKDKNRPSMQVFWQLPEVSELHKSIKDFSEQIKFGDPYYLAKQYGIGRVVACTSAAGSSWNDLEGLSLSHFPPLMMSFQRYLASGSTDLNLILGMNYEFRLNEKSYSAKVKRYFFSQAESAGAMKGRDGTVVLDRGEQTLQTKVVQKPVPKDDKKDGKKEKETDPGEPEKYLSYDFGDTTQPGGYLFQFTEVIPPAAPGGDPKLKPDYRALAYNINARQEGNLERADKDYLKVVAGKEARIVTPSTVETIEEDLKKKQHDLSESSWIYLLMILLLLAEQAMAVRLSFHTRGSDA